MFWFGLIPELNWLTHFSIPAPYPLWGVACLKFWGPKILWRRFFDQPYKGWDQTNSKKVQFAAIGLHFASMGRYIPHNNHCEPYENWCNHGKKLGLIGEFYKSQHFAPIRSFFAVVSHHFFLVFFFVVFFWFPSTPSMDQLQNRLVLRCASAKGRLKLTRFICRECPAKGHELISICIYTYRGNIFTC